MQIQDFDAQALLGQTVEQYQIESLIASGGMGNLYRVLATQAPIQPTYRALKLLTPQGQAHRDVVERFHRECRILKLLEHPNIVHVREFGTYPEQGPYMIMEYLEGKTLKEYSKHRTDPFPIPMVLSWIQQVCQALHFCHHKNIIHRDIKPANLFMHEPEGQEELVKLLDFGIAFSPTEPDKPGERVGTPRYMAPEQVALKPVSRQTDVYSLGIVIFELLTRRVVFKETDSHLLRQAQLQRTPPRLEDVRPDLIFHEELEAYMQSILAKDPQQRPPSAPALFQKLSSLLNTYPIQKKDGPLGIVIQNKEQETFFASDAPTPPPTLGQQVNAPTTDLGKGTVDPFDDWEDHALQSNTSSNTQATPSGFPWILIVLLTLGLSVLGGVGWYIWKAVS